MSEERAVYYTDCHFTSPALVVVEERTGTRTEQEREYLEARRSMLETSLAYAREDEENAVAQVGVYLARAKAARQRQAAIEEQIAELESGVLPEVTAPEGFRDRVMERIAALTRANERRVIEGR